MSDHLLVNKFAAAALAAALGFIGITKISDAAVHSDIPEVPAYRIAVLEAGPVEEVEAPFPSAAFIAAMDPVKGAKVFKKCTSCHNATDGGKNGTGPALWSVLGRTTANVDGFSYSSGMTSLGGTWGYEELNAFLTKPKDFVPKTKMAFIGLKKEADRAALIAFLRQQSSTQIAMPVEAALPVVEGAHEMVEGTHDVVDGIVEDMHDTVKEVIKEMPKVEEHKTEGGH